MERFVHLFVREVLAIAAADVRARGGNAFVSYRIKDCDILDNPHKNQGQCLLAIQGDAAQLVNIEEESASAAWRVASYEDSISLNSRQSAARIDIPKLVVTSPAPHAQTAPASAMGFSLLERVADNETVV